MTRELFDRHLRRLRRDRAVRQGMDLFLLDRAFDDCVERIAAINRRFSHALLLGAASPRWTGVLEKMAAMVSTFDPSALLAPEHGDEDRHDFGESRFDLVVAVGTLDTVNDLPVALQLLRRSMTDDAPLIGAMAGGDTLPALRAALIEADRGTGRVAARAHPRVDGPTLAQLLASAGFPNPVVDVDRVTLRYRTLTDLVRDLRAMGATNVLGGPRAPLNRASWAATAAAFEAGAIDGRTNEQVDILHFLGWTPAHG